MNTSCPVCYQSLHCNEAYSAIALCSNCGWSQNVKPQKKINKTQISIMKSMIAASIGFLLLLFHFSKWGSDSANIVYLKTAEVLGLAGPEQYNQLFEVYKKGNRHDSMENTLKNYYQNTGEPEQLKALALFQMRREKTASALQTYEKYFSVTEDSPIDAQSAFNYAKLLEQNNQPEQALVYYGKIISQQEKNIIPVNAVRNKLYILVRLDRQQEALQLVNQYKKLKHEDKYLKQEIAHWEKQILGKS